MLNVTPINLPPREATPRESLREVPPMALPATDGPSMAEQEAAGDPSDRPVNDDSAVARPIGEILIEAGRMDAAGALRVLALQRERPAPFGELAVALRLVGPDDVAYALARQFALPRLAPGDASLDPALVAAHQPDSPVAVRLRAVRDTLVRAAVAAGRLHPAVAVMSVDHGDGRSFVAGNLAIVAAQLGLRTLLIDADLYRPSQHRLFRIGGGPGLSAFLAARIDEPPVPVQVPALPGLHVLSAGAVPPNPSELLARPRFGDLLRHADRAFQMIVIDSPPASEGHACHLIGREAATAVLVARAGATRVQQARALAGEIGRSPAQVLGVVLNAGR